MVFATNLTVGQSVGRIIEIDDINATSNERWYPDGRFELIKTVRVEASPLYNHDLAPVPISRRTWTTYNYAALWISMAHCIPNYMLASGLMAAGMSWAQALLTILLGNTIVLIPILLNSHPGTRYGIPFPVFARAAYGTMGSNLPALMRALVACGWFGIETWIGGEALHIFFVNMIPNWHLLLGAGFGGHTSSEWLSFLLFWGLTATATGCALAWGGLVVPVLGRLYDYSWFVGLLTSAAVYWTLSVAASRSPLTAQDATR